MKSVVVVLAVGLLVAGCGGSDDEPKSAADSPTSAETSASPARSLKDTCPLIEQATPNDMMAPAGDWAALGARLDELSEQGDVESQNAIRLLQDASAKMAANPAAGQAYLDASSSVTSALLTISDRCRTAGSSAFQ